MLFYATGTQKVKRKGEDGKEVTVSITVKLEHPTWTNRLTARIEAENCAKRNKITLDGLHMVQSKPRGGSVMTKGLIKAKRKRKNGNGNYINA